METIYALAWQGRRLRKEDRSVGPGYMGTEIKLKQNRMERKNKRSKKVDKPTSKRIRKMKIGLSFKYRVRYRTREALIRLFITVNEKMDTKTKINWYKLFWLTRVTCLSDKNLSATFDGIKNFRKEFKSLCKSQKGKKSLFKNWVKYNAYPLLSTKRIITHEKERPIYICIYSCKVGDRSRGWYEGSLFDSYYTKGGGATSFPWIAPLYPWSLQCWMLSKLLLSTNFLSLCYDSTWDWTQVSQATGEHIYIYIYIYNFIKHNRHFMSTYFLLDPFEFPYYFYSIWGESIYVLSIVVCIRSTFCPTLGHHQGRIYYKSDVTFVLAYYYCVRAFLPLKIMAFDFKWNSIISASSERHLSTLALVWKLIL